MKFKLRYIFTANNQEKKREVEAADIKDEVIEIGEVVEPVSGRRQKMMDGLVFIGFGIYHYMSDEAENSSEIKLRFQDNEGVEYILKHHVKTPPGGHFQSATVTILV